MSKTAAKSLAAVIKLWKNDWQSAFNFSDDVIRNAGLTLASGTDYTSTFAKNEGILELATTVDGVSFLDQLYNYNTPTNYSEFTLSADVYNLFEVGDLRKTLYEIKGLKTTTSTGNVSKNYYFTTKYKTGTKGLLYRLTELYFIRAEAELNLNRNAEALQDINKIRNRAGLTDLSAPLTIDILLNEKRKEFPMENKYFFDLMRNHKNVVRNSGCISVNCSPSYPNNKFVAPLPQNAIEVNSSLKQNPGY